MEQVKIEIVDGVKCFTYKGIEMDRETWESAGCPIYCGKITDEVMCMLVKELYEGLVAIWGEDSVKMYIKKGTKYKRFDEIDDTRWREEEILIMTNGGIYYEDMTDEEYNALNKE